MTRRPAYRHRTNTATASTSRTDSVIASANHLLSVPGSGECDGIRSGCRGNRAAPCGATSDYGRCISRRRRSRLWPARRTGTPVPGGSRAGQSVTSPAHLLSISAGQASFPGTKGAQRDSPGYRRHRESLIPAGPPYSIPVGWAARLKLFRFFVAHPFAFLIRHGASRYSRIARRPVAPALVCLSRRADRLWPPFLRNCPGGTGPRRNLSGPVRAGARGRFSHGTKRAGESVVTVGLVPVGVARPAQ